MLSSLQVKTVASALLSKPVSGRGGVNSSKVKGDTTFHGTLTPKMSTTKGVES